MPLNLNQFKPKEEEIIFGEPPNEKRFIVTPYIPRKLYREYAKIAEITDTDELLDKSEKWLIDILSIKNDRAEVKEFVESLEMYDMNRVSTSISEYLQEVNKGEKKKD